MDDLTKNNIIKFPTPSIPQGEELSEEMMKNLPPEVVEVPTLLSDGVFGISVNNVVHSTVIGNLVVFWFNEDHMDEKHGWDLQIPFDSEEEAKMSLEMFHDASRRIKMGVVK